ncbi:hypothetical protein K443DRAFT_334080 [Laccaria amethystina LaAM-08-1]|uniref:Uncharacterized protein n=1 Tax=Laccaria amethystina LaAM-08-1 TaxID=1095629 RepID=A0A0C9YBY2_9AGAR|nr:hypothetical protein K443DRAFT_334080 [Laccaria amethystina LaAM-08-1]
MAFFQLDFLLSPYPSQGLGNASPILPVSPHPPGLLPSPLPSLKSTQRQFRPHSQALVHTTRGTVFFTSLRILTPLSTGCSDPSSGYRSQIFRYCEGAMIGRSEKSGGWRGQTRFTSYVATSLITRLLTPRYAIQTRSTYSMRNLRIISVLLALGSTSVS